jgi:hypothetical protein
MPGLDGNLHVVADHARAAAARRHRTRVGIGERDLLIGCGQHLLLDRRELLEEAARAHGKELLVVRAARPFRLSIKTRQPDGSRGRPPTPADGHSRPLPNNTRNLEPDPDGSGHYKDHAIAANSGNSGNSRRRLDNPYLRLGGRPCHRFGLLGLVDANLTSLVGAGLPSIDKR